ncbi:c2h2 finger domain-containing protein [Colletotrichum incanum]|uniref:C2h2 finger domain-containing protein n=1 Tax=Colletotrichum incanum TaxID=1573173 RepID=A0A162P922_COLIC|nr:c2h2 finger domain-containing protein [Colletotrichum incanum]
MELVELVENDFTARPFECNWQLCTKRFDTNANLQRHRRIHTNERPYSCTAPGCDKGFIQRSALTVHTRTHTGEKPHQCQHIGCGRRFSDSSSLARHRRVHNDKRPYKCAHDGCLKSFWRKTTLERHQRRSYQCSMRDGGDILDDCTFDSDSGEPPSTPRHANMQQPPQPQSNNALNDPSTDPGVNRSKLNSRTDLSSKDSSVAPAPTRGTTPTLKIEQPTWKEPMLLQAAGNGARKRASIACRSWRNEKALKTAGDRLLSVVDTSSMELAEGDLF